MEEEEEEKKENDPPMEAIVIPSDSDGRFPLADHASAGDSQLVHESLFSLYCSLSECEHQCHHKRGCSS